MDELKDGFQGRVIVPRDEGYEEARTLFNAMIDKRPAVIAQCESPDDVAAAVRFGREHGSADRRARRRPLGRRACRRWTTGSWSTCAG